MRGGGQSKGGRDYSDPSVTNITQMKSSVSVKCDCVGEKTKGKKCIYVHLWSAENMHKIPDSLLCQNDIYVRNNVMP